MMVLEEVHVKVRVFYYETILAILIFCYRYKFQCLKKTYYANSFSMANFWRWFSSTITIVLTVVVVFETQGMWKKINSYVEQPHMELENNIFVILSGDSGDPFDYYFWSPFEDLNKAQNDRLITPVISSTQDDYNEDGVTDKVGV